VERSGAGEDITDRAGTGDIPRAAIAASVGPTTTAPTTRGQGYASEPRSGERGDYRPTLDQDQDDDHDRASALPANAVLLLEPGSDINKEPRPFQISGAFRAGRVGEVRRRDDAPRFREDDAQDRDRPFRPP